VKKALAAVSLACCADLHAFEVRGLVDVRAVASDATRSWTREGLDKSRFDERSDGVRLGHAFLRLDADPLHDVTAALVASLADDRGGALDVNEAWLGWNPVPTGPWKLRARAGAFFPAMNLEIDYDSIGWTPARTISASAINAWIGEEIRAQGVELSALRKGAMAGSPHDFGVSVVVFGRNDPAGTLLAWRGWSVGDRITGLTEPIGLPDLPVYRPGGALAGQSSTLHVSREIDGRAGYYAAGRYGYGSRLEVEAMHYDNRADPLVLVNGQYSWRTHFDHVGVRAEPGGEWVWLVQALRGETIMGPDAVRLRFDAVYALASHPVGRGQATVRYDRFRAREHPADILPEDPNSENGHAIALAYAHRVGRAIELVAEALEIRSDRPARVLFGAPERSRERSLTLAIRWRF
jgi:hypothetical protein